MGADLEALFEHFRARGLDDEEAARRAEQRMLASPEALQHLVRVHTTGYQRWLSRAAGRLRRGMDLLLLGLGVAPVLVAVLLALAARVDEVRGEPLSWLLLAAAVPIASISLWKAWQLFVRRERSLPRLHRGLFTLLFLGVETVALGALSALLSLHAFALEAMQAGGPAQAAVAQRVAGSASLLAVGLLLGLGAGLVWFVLANRVAAIEQAESAALLAG